MLYPGRSLYKEQGTGLSLTPRGSFASPIAYYMTFKISESLTLFTLHDFNYLWSVVWCNSDMRRSQDDLSLGEIPAKAHLTLLSHGNKYQSCLSLEKSKQVKRVIFESVEDSSAAIVRGHAGSMQRQPPPKKKRNYFYTVWWQESCCVCVCLFLFLFFCSSNQAFWYDIPNKVFQMRFYAAYIFMLALQHN